MHAPAVYQARAAVLALTAMQETASGRDELQILILEDFARLRIANSFTLKESSTLYNFK
jgi:hypothetical protein